MSTNMFLKFESPNIAGTATEKGHEHEIEILSWSHGFVQPTSPTRSTAGSGTAGSGTAGSGTAEQANHQNLTFTKYMDPASTELMKLCWSGKQIEKATLTCLWRNEHGTTVRYLTIIMEHVIISSFSVSGGPGDVPVENVALDYGRITYTYEPQKENTGLSAHHDLATGEIK